MESGRILLFIFSAGTLAFGFPSKKSADPWNPGSEQQRNEGRAGCKRCRRDTNKIEQMQVELVKQRILQGLGLDEAPKISRRSKIRGLPEPMWASLTEARIDVESLREEQNQAFILPHKGANDTDSTSSIWVYNISPKLLGVPFRSVQFWTKYPGPSLGLQFRLEDSTRPDHSSFWLETKKADWKQGWLGYNFTQQLQSFLLRYEGLVRVPTITLSVITEKLPLQPLTETYGSTPFLTMDFSGRRQLRKKRSVACEEGSKRCCVRPLTVNFRDIGWDDFILQPASIDTNVCTGDCDLSVPLTKRGFFRRLKQHVRSSKGLKLCCSGRKFSGVQILYFDGDGDNRRLYKKYVDNLIIEECWCG